ncbi:thymidylate synthase [Auritidibacter ignavus]|uniref:thymidylate synthase n=1 Tax=Auritidibacter ignavus TaxID=678932 RepID=UPI001CB73E51|nr:thymidylate synthase [Auritidibacter ignavus]
MSASAEDIVTPYEDLLADVLKHGTAKTDRTGTGTYSVFGRQMRFDLSSSFPLITTKRVHFKSVVLELLWFLRGESNVRWLQERGVTIWNEWADENGDLGPVYGVQWRSWPTPSGETIDQISQLMQNLKTSPDSRRHVVTAWNPGQLSEMALPACHALFQFYVAPTTDGSTPVLSCQLYQRSADMFLGVPFNIAEYSLLTLMIADQLGYQPGEFIWTGGDTHIYTNHVDQVKEQLTRAPYPYPRVRIRRTPQDLFSYEFEDFELLDYQHHPTIKAPVAV